MARVAVTRQIRMDPNIYAALEEYARAKQVSINQAIQDIVASVVLPWKAGQESGQDAAAPAGKTRRKARG